MSRRAWSPVLAVSVAMVAQARLAGAEPRTPGSQARQVQVAIAGPSDEAAALEEVVRELMARMPVGVDYARPSAVDPTDVITPRADAAPAVARVWLDLGRPGRATVFLVDEPWERILVRHVDAPNGVDEVTRETIGHIVQSSVEAMLAGQRIGLAREEARAALGLGPVAADAPPGSSPKAAPPVPGRPDRGVRADRAPASLGLDVGVRYEALAWSRESPALHGPGVAVSTTFGAALPRVGVEASGQYRFPTTVEGKPAGVRLDSGALRLVAIADLALSRSVLARAAAGGGLDLVGVEARIVAGTDTTAEPAELTLVPQLRAAVAAASAADGGHRLWGGIAAELDLTDTRYVVDVEGERVTVFDPWRTRVGVYVGATTRVLGP